MDAIARAIILVLIFTDKIYIYIYINRASVANYELESVTFQ